MSRPIRLTPGGPWYLKERTPRDVLAKVRGLKVALPIAEVFTQVTVGEAVQVSLQTKDEREAKARHAKAADALRTLWAAHRAGPKPLSHKVILSLAGEFYRSVVAEHEDDPGEAEHWHHEQLRAAITRIAGFDPTYDVGLAIGIRSEPQVAMASEDRALVRLYDQRLDHLLSRKGLVVDQASRLKLMREVGEAFEQAAGQLKRNAEGDYRPDTEASRFPAWVGDSKSGVTVAPSSSRTAPLNVEALAKAYLKAQEGKKAVNTLKRYAPSLASLAAFTSDREAASVTSDDIFEWAVHRRDNEGIDASTVNKNDLVAASSMFKWAMSREGGKRVPANPVTKDTRLDELRKVRTRGKNLRDDEVKAILRAASAVKSDDRNPTSAAAKRWCPWLAAYSGARITELTKLRGSDVRTEDGVPVMDFWDTKTREPRTVPIHEHVIEQGFLEYANSRGTQPLFYDPKRHNPATKTDPAEIRSRKVAEWVREETGLDMQVKANHAWRHTWATKAAEAGIEEMVRVAITGHAEANVGRSYVNKSVGLLGKAMATFPRYGVD